MTNLVVTDADALVALMLEEDPNHRKAVDISRRLIEQGTTTIYPVTVFPEAITTLKRAFNQPEKAHLINKQLMQGIFQISYITPEIIHRASEIFDKAKSKKNTLFDAIVAATAEKLETNQIFSFDSWYPKIGFKLAEE